MGSKSVSPLHTDLSSLNSKLQCIPYIYVEKYGISRASLTDRVFIFINLLVRLDHFLYLVGFFCNYCVSCRFLSFTFGVWPKVSYVVVFPLVFLLRVGIFLRWALSLYRFGLRFASGRKYQVFKY